MVRFQSCHALPWDTLAAPPEPTVARGGLGHHSGSANATDGPRRERYLKTHVHDVKARCQPMRKGEDDLSRYLLRLFVTGKSLRTTTAVNNLRRICEQELAGAYELEIIDVLEYPDLAEDEKILATPTLIKSLPLPLRRVIGDLSDKEKVLFGLQVEPRQDRVDAGENAP